MISNGWNRALDAWAAAWLSGAFFPAKMSRKNFGLCSSWLEASVSEVEESLEVYEEASESEVVSLAIG